MKHDGSFFKMPHVEKGMRVGLYGGSFNPPHHGHKLLAELALIRFKLDQLWWMVTPGNPLKSERDLASVEQRVAQSRAMLHHPRIRVTAFESGFYPNRSGHYCSADTVARLRQCHKNVHFVWLMGADNLAGFHLWQRWRELADRVAIGIIDRHGITFKALASPVAHTLSRFRLPATQAPHLALMCPPVWCFLPVMRLDISSSRIRAIINSPNKES